jgi:CHAD domain-containing protein
MLASPVPSTRSKKAIGLRYWMSRVLQECDEVSAGFNPDPVHDLRVSLRRCRSLADGLMALDPHPDWKAMKKAGKRLFQRLGDLRDIHVMEEWVEKLETSVEKALVPMPSLAMLASVQNPDPVADSAGQSTNSSDAPAQALLKILKQREYEQKHAAQTALEGFDRKQWRRWSKSLPARAARIRPGSPLFKHLALERWTEARSLHTRALRNPSQAAWHSLRIGLKRFRYIVENFLPLEHKAWSDDLKEMQDLLGDVHDLDVLWSTAISWHIFRDDRSRERWHQRVLTQRSNRIDRYRAKMIGEDSLWRIWRAALPTGKQIQELATRRMKLWANNLDPDFAHSEHVASLSLQLYDGLIASGWQPAIDAVSARSSLLVAALLHDVGKSKGGKNHHKASLKLMQAHGNPQGWKPTDFRRAAIVARFHRGALPSRRHKLLRDLLPDEQKATIQLAAILRLANAVDARHGGHIRRIQIENIRVGVEARRGRRTAGFLRKPSALNRNEPLIIAAEGYIPLGPSAQAIAAERHLLETVLRRPVIVKAMRNPERVSVRA